MARTKITLMQPIKWIPPKLNYYKLNTDKAASSVTHKAGIGGLICDSNGNWIIGFVGNLDTATTIHAELKVLFHGLKLANTYNLVLPEINIDASEVLTMLKNDNIVYTNILVDCRYLLGQLHSATIAHTYREGNEVADGWLRRDAPWNLLENHPFLKSHRILSAPFCKWIRQERLVIGRQHAHRRNNMWTGIKTLFGTMMLLNKQLPPLE
ncbi:hypothetical protein A4A49_51277 [Nicotiana attenuata]|uniref:RNase H type-1 domain-containing protein n=1 Tax=Nicotiana attenuata TaxID=49451 RepID=A0A1J6JCZ6_NICAT|nr:hypothetical protein A4A49_51277 [Nicotiana attenuata]